MKNFVCGVVLLLCTLVFGSGCASISSKIISDAEFKNANKYYVARQPKDERGIEKMIADGLTERGYNAASGTRSEIASDTDVLVTYEDRWMWDITMYLLSLKIHFRDPENDYALASGTSKRPSLVRRTPKTMVNEILDEIFSKINL